MGRRKGLTLSRRQVVEAGVACVQAEGADALGISPVARILGVQPPSLYNHVAKGDDLARAVVIEATRMLLAHLVEVVGPASDPALQLRALAHGTRAWALDNPGLYALMARVEPDNADPEFVPVMADLLALFGQPLGKLGVAEQDMIHAIRALRATMHGFVLLETTGQLQLAEDPADSFAWAIDAFLRGLDRRGGAA